MGFINDANSQIPSILHDGEYQELTSFDDLMPRMLYDPRLPVGASRQDARPANWFTSR